MKRSDLMFIALGVLVAAGGIAGVVAVKKLSAGPQGAEVTGVLGGARRLGAGDCRPKKLAATESCIGEDASFQECRYWMRATGRPDASWCRAVLDASSQAEEPSDCDFEAPGDWLTVDCARYGLASFDKCVLCVAGGHEDRRTYVYGYDQACSKAVEQATCNVDPIEAGRTLEGARQP